MTSSGVTGPPHPAPPLLLALPRGAPPFLDGGKAEPLLHPVGHAEQFLVLEGGAHQLQTNGKPPHGQGHRHRDGGEAWGGRGAGVRESNNISRSLTGQFKVSLNAERQ